MGSTGTGCGQRELPGLSVHPAALRSESLREYNHDTRSQLGNGVRGGGCRRQPLSRPCGATAPPSTPTPPRSPPTELGLPGRPEQHCNCSRNFASHGIPFESFYKPSDLVCYPSLTSPSCDDIPKTMFQKVLTYSWYQHP